MFIILREERGGEGVRGGRTMQSEAVTGDDGSIIPGGPLLLEM